MHVYRNDAWTSGYLDETPRDGRVRVTVHRQVALGPAQDQFFVRPPKLAMLANYVRMLGPRRVIRKVVSRRQESARNDAWVSVGCGTGPDGGPVHFVATAAPLGVDRLLVPQELVFDAPPAVLASGPGHYAPAGPGGRWAGLAEPVRHELEAIGGWNPEEGTPAALSAAACEAIVGLVAAPPSPAYAPLSPVPPSDAIRERVAGAPSEPDGRPGFHLFGYGQYAKTQVIPNLGRHLRLDCVHELSPLQIGPVGGDAAHGWDTAGWPRPDEAIEHAVVAGYHHTHPTLAAALFDRGVRHVVVEKPIASAEAQLEQLLAALERNPDARLHLAFQRRYSPFNRLLLEDLGGVPISMAATVYEVPLPARHWYRWPIVGNAVVSNGCHWIDHFLFLNDYSPVVRTLATRLATQTVLGLELTNGASATISLRHEGAPRRGVRDRCSFWHDDASATIDDLRTYTSERGFRQLRHRTTHPYRALELMYEEFGRRIVADLPGDDPRHVHASATATLDLARAIDAER